MADAALLVDESYNERPEFKPLPKPDNGIHFHLGPFDMQPNFERELFAMVPLGNDEVLFVERFEMSMKSGLHHFCYTPSKTRRPTSGYQPRIRYAICAMSRGPISSTRCV